MKASACAKLILFGEHSVVYGYPAIAVPLKELRLEVDISKSKSDSGLQTRQKKALIVARQMLRISGRHKVKIMSKIPMAAGLGSSAALCVAILKALCKLHKMKCSTQLISDVAFEMERIFHNNPSGIDTTVIVKEKPVYFQKGKKIQILKIKKPFKIAILNAGRRASTSEIVARVAKEAAKNPRYGQLFHNMGRIANKAKGHLEKGENSKLPALVNLNQTYLNGIGVSTKKIDLLVKQIKQKGGAAKISGAGKGGFIYFMPPEIKIRQKKLILKIS